MIKTPRALILIFWGIAAAMIPMASYGAAAWEVCSSLMLILIFDGVYYHLHSSTSRLWLSSTTVGPPQRATRHRGQWAVWPLG